MRMKLLAVMDRDFGKGWMSLQEAAPVLSGAGAHVLGLEALPSQNLLIHLPEVRSAGSHRAAFLPALTTDRGCAADGMFFENREESSIQSFLLAQTLQGSSTHPSRC